MSSKWNQPRDGETWAEFEERKKQELAKRQKEAREALVKPVPTVKEPPPPKKTARRKKKPAPAPAAKPRPYPWEPPREEEEPPAKEG